MIKQTMVATLAGLCVLTGAVQAEPGQGKQRQRIAEMDTDGDGGVSEEEFIAAHMDRLKKRFAKLDQNGDGILSPQEFRKGKKKRMNRGENRRGQGPDMEPDVEADETE